MAYPMFLMNELTVGQMNILLPQRQRNGFHTYFTNGYYSSKRFFVVTFATNLVEDVVFTTFFRFGSRGTRKAGKTQELRLATENELLSRYFALGFSDQYQVNKKEDKFSAIVSHNPNPIPTPVNGLHVLQCNRSASGIEIHLDGVLVAPADFFSYPHLEHFVKFYTPTYSNSSDFMFYETHFTMDDVVTRFTQKTFRKQEFGYTISGTKIWAGDYLQWSGQWPPSTDFIVWFYSTELGRLQVPSSGTLVAVLKIYHSGITLTNAKLGLSSQSVMAPLPQALELEGIKCTPPTSFTEYKFVTAQARAP